MNLPYIKFHLPQGGEYTVPNRWELLTPEQFLSLFRLLEDYSSGTISFRELHIRYVCRSLGLDSAGITDETAAENIYLLSTYVDFIFKNPKEINACFLSQLVPVLEVRKRYYEAYRIHTGYDTLTCSLTAIQFIEGYELLGCPAEKLPLLAAILYLPGKYTSERAHVFAGQLADVDPIVLQAVSFNFMAFTAYLFTRTPFHILRSKKEGAGRTSITIGMAESLYNLSADGLGDVETIEQMPVIKYLTILRKKLIEGVKAMRDAQMSVADISANTGLPMQTIKKIT
ncbi:MAG: hypothetical protein LBS88_09720 [Tannerellaceae bacterium]|jgi:hypothetical protein|nr:hypothetical protein [Tannerellaceae bacterium]